MPCHVTFMPCLPCYIHDLLMSLLCFASSYHHHVTCSCHAFYYCNASGCILMLEESMFMLVPRLVDHAHALVCTCSYSSCHAMLVTSSLLLSCYFVACSW